MIASTIESANRGWAAWCLPGLLTVSLLFGAAEPCYSESYPERPIRIVVPFPAGGPTDVAARLIAKSLSSTLRQDVIVDNQAGAGGRIGSKAVARANPDGYTLLLGGTNVNAIVAVLYKDLGYDPINSFAPVAAISIESMVMVVSHTVPAKTLQEFIRHAKDNPGKLKYGAPPGINTHFAGEFFKKRTGTDILFVPYKGGAPAITDALGGHIDIVFNMKGVLLPLIREGKLKALAVTSEARWSELPDVPTMSENGLVGFPPETWYGLLAPAATPVAIIDRLNGAVNEGLRSAEVRATLAKLGIEPKIGTPQEFAAALVEQSRNWKAIVEATGIKVE